jgi:hypothetical protein
MTPDTPTQAAALPELPEPHWRWQTGPADAFTADQMRAYAQQALQEACAERDALRARLGAASVFEIGDATVERAKQRDGSYLWAARSESGLCLNKSGEWEYEPMPSSRDDDFLFRCRFATAEEAAAAITNARKEGA